MLSSRIILTALFTCSVDAKRVDTWQHGVRSQQTQVENCLDNIANDLKHSGEKIECGKVAPETIQTWLTSCGLGGSPDHFSNNSWNFKKQITHFTPKVGTVGPPAMFPTGMPSVEAACPDYVSTYSHRESLPQQGRVRPAFANGEFDMPTASKELENVLSTLSGNKIVTIVYPIYHSAEQLCLYAHAAVATTCYSSADGFFDVLAHSRTLGSVAQQLQNADASEADVDGLFALDVQAAMGLVYGYGVEPTIDYLQDNMIRQCEKYPNTKTCRLKSAWEDEHGPWVPQESVERSREWLKVRKVEV